jgi:two-component sensor histidine kinase/PAS domain-containing protein
MFRLQQLSSKDVSLRAFVVAGGLMAVAVALRAALDPVLPGLPPFLTLYPAVALAGVLCGPWAAGMSGLVGVLVAVFFWIAPRLTFHIADVTDDAALGVFVVASCIVLWATAVLRAQHDAATVARHALDLGLSAGGIGTWEINLRTGRITASSAAHDLHGLAEGRRTVAEDWRRGVPAEDAAVASEVLRAAVADGSLAAYTYRVVSPADGPRWISARGRVLATGRERRLVCALVDVTEQVRVQDEMRRERERLRLALQAGSLAVWDHHPGTGETTIDARYAAIMGFAPDVRTLTRAQIGERMHPEDRPRVAAEHAAILASGGDYHIEYRIVTPGGEVRWLVSQAILIRPDIPGDPGRLVGVIQDITGRKRREEDLRELAAARELLVREADHRIKNSLQLVVSLLTMQLRGVADPGAADALREAITRVGAIAASHLALQGSEDLRQLDLAVTLRELCAHFAQLHPGITILCRPGLCRPGLGHPGLGHPGLCHPGTALMLDADRAIPLGLAVSEVLTNALRHAFPDRATGTVIVDAFTEAGGLIVRVSDDGVGMQPHAVGAGLGSRIIRSLASRLDASIAVESTPEVGTVVTLRLKLLQEAPAQPAVA